MSITTKLRLDRAGTRRGGEISTTDGTHVATVYSHPDGPDYAAMFAALPELVAALRGLSAAAKRGMVGSDSSEQLAAREALKKAGLS